MIEAIKDPLYDEAMCCLENCIVLPIVLGLLKLNTKNGWSDTGFTDLLEFLGEILPKPDGLPTSPYVAKKLICPLTLGVQQIHVCSNHYILYRRDHKDAMCYSICKISRYKNDGSDYVTQDGVLHGIEWRKTKKQPGTKRKSSGEVATEGDCKPIDGRKVPRLVMWYLPVINRLRCFH